MSSQWTVSTTCANRDIVNSFIALDIVGCIWLVECDEKAKTIRRIEATCMRIAPLRTLRLAVPQSPLGKEHTLHLYQMQYLDDHVLAAKGSGFNPRGICLFLTFSDTAFTFAFS